MELMNKYAYSVYQEKSFTKSAEKLHISQPSLSAMIKKLESKLGFFIFDRKMQVQIALKQVKERKCPLRRDIF